MRFCDERQVMEREQFLFKFQPGTVRRPYPVVSRRQGQWWFEQIQKAIEEACDPSARQRRHVQPQLPLKMGQNR
jgi:hypothetical protein